MDVILLQETHFPLTTGSSVCTTTATAPTPNAPCWRSMLSKQVDYEVINIDLVNKPEWFADKSILGAKVPALEIREGEVIIESLITVEYIDAMYPQRPLLPQDPLKRAQNKILIEVVAKTIEPLIIKLVKNHAAVTQDLIAEYHKGLQYVQDLLRKRATTYLDGDQPGYSDYMIWVWFERTFAFHEEFVQITDLKYSLLNSYIKKMTQDSVVKLTMVPKDIMHEFLMAYRFGKHNYDLLQKYL